MRTPHRAGCDGGIVEGNRDESGEEKVTIRGTKTEGRQLNERLLNLAVDLSDTASLFVQRARDSGDHLLYAEAARRQREVLEVIAKLDEEVIG